ncbi:MAG: ABC transporter permease [Bacteroidetes bacterium]|nr:MAG: ABC transporter permease [Bacteroidota bacterium]
MKKFWWKILGVAMVLFSIIFGLLGKVPALPILNESIRNLYFHVPMWFAMILLLLVAFIFSIISLNKGTQKADLRANELTNSAIFLGVMGLLTGMIWATFTWGKPWTNDPKLNSVAIGMLIYLGYIILRQAIEDREKRARVSAVFNIFAFPIFVVLIFVLPRIEDSLHPGNGGNPGFNTYDLDNNMRPIFYMAVFGWTLIGVWISELRSRIRNIEYHIEENE